MMDFLQRVKRNSKRIMRMRPSAMSPAACVRKDLLAGAWSEGKPLDRLARFCDTVLGSLRSDQVLSAGFNGHKGLKFAKAPAVWIGPRGGKSWRRFSSTPIDAASLESMLSASPSVTGQVHDKGLEVLDLSELDICDWKGGLANPQVARLVLLAPSWRASSSGESEQYFGLVLDFDQRLIDAHRAVAFLGSLASKLVPEKNA